MQAPKLKNDNCSSSGFDDRVVRIHDRFSVNLVAWLGADGKLLEDFGEDDEVKLTERPKSLMMSPNSPSLVDGRG